MSMHVSSMYNDYYYNYTDKLSFEIQINKINTVM